MRVELKNVRKSFGSVIALRGVTFELPHGSRAALYGPNGSGKSTLLRAILGMISCEGEVLLDGRSVFRDRAEIAERLAYVPQIAPRISAPVRDLVRATASARAIDPASISSYASRLGLDLDPIASRAFRDLSGGMKQKLLIALAFASPATLLVLDEPTASLDPPSREAFEALFEERAAGCTVLICSHLDADLNRFAERKLWLREGVLGESVCSTELASA